MSELLVQLRRVGAELLVANRTCTPAPRNRATASSTPAIGWPVSQTTPSRSRTQVPWDGGGHIGPRLTGSLDSTGVADLEVDGTELVLHMGAREKAEGMHGDIRMPLSPSARSAPSTIRGPSCAASARRAPGSPT